MIINKQGQGIVIGKDFYYVGMRVIANENSVYAGLTGIITEIRTGGDKDTENPGEDIYCAFDEPEEGGSPSIAEIEGRFSGLYGIAKTIGDLGLDEVVMAPGMLVPLRGAGANSSQVGRQ